MIVSKKNVMLTLKMNICEINLLLDNPCFSHGQLNMACSRIRK